MSKDGQRRCNSAFEQAWGIVKLVSQIAFSFVGHVCTVNQNTPQGASQVNVYGTGMRDPH
jgi:hypothetical protein